MPGRNGAESAEMRAIREVSDEDEKTLDRLALESGPPPEATRLSEAEEDEAWETVDPLVDDEQLPTLLMTQGLPPEIAQRLLVLKLHPEWTGHYAKPTQDAEMANQLAQMAKTPFRWSLLEDIEDFEERARKAESLKRRYDKRMTQLQEQMSQPGMAPTTGYGGMTEGR